MLDCWLSQLPSFINTSIFCIDYDHNSFKNIHTFTNIQPKGVRLRRVLYSKAPPNQKSIWATTNIPVQRSLFYDIPFSSICMCFSHGGIINHAIPHLQIKVAQMAVQEKIYHSGLQNVPNSPHPQVDHYCLSRYITRELEIQRWCSG